MAAPPAAWGLTHINKSGEVGSKEKARRNGDEERETTGKNRNNSLKWDYKERKYRDKEKENRSGLTCVRKEKKMIQE